VKLVIFESSEALKGWKYRLSLTWRHYDWLARAHKLVSLSKELLINFF
jgi:hypothetical protein